MATDLSPTARALRALEVLRNRPGTTAGELAERLGVTERAARRYVAILREAGIPVQSTRGPYGGYRLGRGTRLPPVVFTEAEGLGLVMAVLDGHPGAALDPDDLVGSALGKVVRALPDEVGRQASALREHAAAAPDRRTRPDPAITSALVAASAAHRRVLLGYRAESGSEWEAEVDPWAVVVRFGRWYVLCHSHRADAVRTYRVDRVRSVAETGDGFTPPPGLDPVPALEEHLGAGWEYDVRVVFDAPLSEVAVWVRPVMGRLEALPADADPEAEPGTAATTATGRCVLTGSTSNPAMYAQEWLAAVPFGFRVEGGDELRSAVARVAARFAAAVT